MHTPPPIHRLIALVAALAPTTAIAEPTPLYQKIDALVAEQAPTGSATALRSTDAGFLRRIYLDFTGNIPTAATTRKFIADNEPDKRTKLIDLLLDGPGYASHMADQFSIFLMERRGENSHWRSWLESSFAENKPWDQMAREIIRADHRDAPNRGAAFFYTKRLEKYGQNPTDYPGLTRDVGRLFLGVDLQCAECHNHRTVKSYKQADFQGLFAAFQNLKLYSADFPAIEEGVMQAPVEFASVFKQKKRTTAPKIPGLAAVDIQAFDKDNAYEFPPDKKAKQPGIPKFSPLAAFAKHLPESPTFAPNIANRLWFLLTGRGIVEPLDLFHPDNPPANPELLSLLATSLAETGYDIKAFLRELARTETYQCSSRLPTPAVERRLSAEQLFAMTLTATGNTADSLGEEKTKSLQAKFLAAFASEPKEPELGFEASLKGALLLLNDPEFASLITPAEGTLAAQLESTQSASEAADQLYLSIFTRFPTTAESAEVAGYLQQHASDRTASITDLIWAMLASTEFLTNH